MPIQGYVNPNPHLTGVELAPRLWRPLKVEVDSGHLSECFNIWVLQILPRASAITCSLREQDLPASKGITHEKFKEMKNKQTVT